MRVVLDTNVVVASVLGGRLSAVIDAWRDRLFEVVVDREIVREYAAVLARPKFGLPPEIQDSILAYVIRRAEFVTVVEQVRAVDADPDDDKFLAVAKTGAVDFIVTGDRHLLKLGSFEEIPIVAPGEFLDRLSG